MRFKSIMLLILGVKTLLAFGEITYIAKLLDGGEIVFSVLSIEEDALIVDPEGNATIKVIKFSEIDNITDMRGELVNISNINLGQDESDRSNYRTERLKELRQKEEDLKTAEQKFLLYCSGLLIIGILVFTS
jgi:hypothetical protein